MRVAGPSLEVIVYHRNGCVLLVLIAQSRHRAWDVEDVVSLPDTSGFIKAHADPMRLNRLRRARRPAGTGATSDARRFGQKAAPLQG